VQLDLTFQLPAVLAWSTSPGKYGTFVQVDAAGLVTVRSYGGAPHLSTIARRFLAKIAGEHDLDYSSIAMRVRATEVDAPALGMGGGHLQEENHSDG
jgi:hypothetical protein